MCRFRNLGVPHERAYFVSESSLQGNIMRSKPGTSGGLDGRPNAVYKKFPEASAFALAPHSESLACSDIAFQWRGSLSVNLSKAKGDPTLLKSSRDISLHDSACKYSLRETRVSIPDLDAYNQTTPQLVVDAIPMNAYHPIGIKRRPVGSGTHF